MNNDDNNSKPINRYPKKNYPRLFYLALFYLLIILFSSISYAGPSYFYDLGDVVHDNIEWNGMLRLSRGIRFYHDGSECRLGALSIEKDNALFFINSDKKNIYKEFRLDEFGKKSFDLDRDYLSEMNIVLDEIIVTNMKKRVYITFSSNNNYSNKQDNDYKKETILDKKEEIQDYNKKIETNDDTKIDYNNNKEDSNNKDENIDNDDKSGASPITGHFVKENNEGEKKPMSYSVYMIMIWVSLIALLTSISIIFYILYKNSEKEK